MTVAPTVSRSLSVSPDAAELTRSLYQRHGQRIFSFCLSRLRDHEEAQDAAQTTFVYVLRALDRGVVPRHEVAWLLKIAENVCRSSRRSLGRRRAVMSPADVTELDAAASSIGYQSAEDLADLHAALGQLPPRQRRAILLREWQGLSYADIGDELRLSVSAVETLLFRARRAMAAHLERTRGALGAVNLGSLFMAARSALQSGAAATAAAGIALAVSPALIPGDAPQPRGAPAQAAVAADSTIGFHTGSARLARPTLVDDFHRESIGLARAGGSGRRAVPARSGSQMPDAPPAAGSPQVPAAPRRAEPPVSQPKAPLPVLPPAPSAVKHVVPQVPQTPAASPLPQVPAPPVPKVAVPPVTTPVPLPVAVPPVTLP